MEYNSEKKNLHVEMYHVTRNSHKHHIRALIVYKNDIKIQTLTYVQQTSASMFIGDVAIAADKGDVLKIEAVCSQAGRNSESLVVE